TSIPDPTSSFSATYSGDGGLEINKGGGGHGGHGKGGKGGKSSGGSGGGGDGDAGDQQSASDAGPKTQLVAVCSWLVLAVMLPLLL
ncbi:hypothetical protein FQN52_001203, partial [Onygenales sp. PD_12]